MPDKTIPLSKDDIYDSLRGYAAAIQHDPQTNSVFRLAQDYFFALSNGDIQIDELFEPVQLLNDELFEERAKFLSRQHGLKDDTYSWTAAKQALNSLADKGFEAFSERISTDCGGIVFTAHPTFAHPLEERNRLARLASGEDIDNTHYGLDASEQTDGISLEEEHEQAQSAIHHAQKSVSKYLSAIFEVAQDRFADRWRELRPSAPTLATWVGYDLDGRSDIAWWTSVAFRLREKAEQLSRCKDSLKSIQETADNPDQFDGLLKAVESSETIARSQSELFLADLNDPEELVKAANGLTDHSSDLFPLEKLVSTIRGLSDGESDHVAKALLCLAAETEVYGFGTSRIHLRINAAQIQTVIRRDLGLMTEDRDLGQVALEALAEKIATAEPAQINFGDLFLEQSTARRQFMLCAQIRKHIDADTPIRFLIAESENPATVLGALYLAKQYGVDDLLDISPLFETPHALENGGRFISRLLKVSEFRDYVAKRGQLAIQLGFSDAGRFIGQISADMAIERIVGQIAGALAERMPGTPLLIFNTHGESIGRGSFPGSFTKRLQHVLPPGLKLRCQNLGTPLRHEVSFQGGDGYLHFSTDVLSDSAYLAFAHYALFEESDALEDPFYSEASLVWDFYSALRAWQEALFADDDYAVLLSDFAGGFLLDAGSRPKRRSKGPAGPRSLRAISHNATLQQLGALANTAGGIGSSLARDIDDLVELANESPRLRDLIDLALFARVRTSIPALRGYANVYSPNFWVACSKRQEEDRRNSRTALAQLLRDGRTHQAMMACANHLSIDLGRFDRLIARLNNSPSVEYRHEARLPIHALHAIRQGAMMRALELAGSLPTISARHGFQIDDVQKLILQMRISEAVDLLRKLFPKSVAQFEELKLLSEERVDRGDLTTSDYTSLHEEFLDPLIEIQKLIHAVSRAIAHAHYAYG